MADSLLIIDSHQVEAAAIASRLRDQGWDVELVSDLREARGRLVGQGFEPLVTLADCALPDGSALDLLSELRHEGRRGEWVLLTTSDGVPESVRALRLGACDCLERPCDLARLETVLNDARHRAAAQSRRENDPAEPRYAPDAFVGRSDAAAEVRQLLSRLVQVPFRALVISGETGTGKGLAARILHHSGARREAPLIEVNCAALPRDLLESELFGHEAGAFTGARVSHRGFLEQADGGTLFLDEIGEMDLDLQAKLLTAIEDGALRRLGGEKLRRVNVQVVAASNHDLERRVCEGAFRADLYHRLSVFHLRLPPLRDRLEDLEDLVPLMVAAVNAAGDRNVTVIPQTVYRQMRRYDWPGNVRELRNVVERAVLLGDGEVFPSTWLQLGDGPGKALERPSGDGSRLVIPLDGSMALHEMDRYIIQSALEKSGYNVAATARTLGTTRETLRYRIQKYQLRIRPPAAEDRSDDLPGGGRWRVGAIWPEDAV